MEPDQEDRAGKVGAQGSPSASALDPRNLSRRSSASGLEVSGVPSSASSIPASRASQERRSRRATGNTDASLGDWWQEEDDTRSRAFTTTLTEYDYDAGMTKTRTIREDDQESQHTHVSGAAQQVSLHAHSRDSAFNQQSSVDRLSAGGDSPKAAEMPRPLLMTSEERRSNGRRDAGADSESDYAALCAELRNLKMELARIKSERATESRGLKAPAQKAVTKTQPQKPAAAEFFNDVACACFRTKKREQGQGEEQDGATSESSVLPMEEAPAYEPSWTGVHGPAFTDMVSSFFKDVLGSEDEDIRRSNPNRPSLGKTNRSSLEKTQW